MLLDPQRLKLSRHFDWHDGKLNTLFQVPGNAVNGIGLLGAENIGTQFNYFQALSRFYSSAVESDLPKVSNPRLERLIAQLATHWSVANECCITGFSGASGDALRAVRPDYVHPVYDEYDNERLERVLFIYPRRRRDENNFSNETIGTDSALVVEHIFETGESFRAIRQYTGGFVADSPRGEAVDIGQVQYIKTGPPVYQTIESLVREICVRLNMLQLALNTTSLPLVQINKDQLNDGKLSKKTLSFEDVKQAATGPLGLTVVPPFSGEAGAEYIERQGRGLEESMEYVRMLLKQLGILAGVPDYIFGIDLAKPNAETERVLFSAQAKVSSFRRLLNEALLTFGVEQEFSPHPFITQSERSKIVLEQLAAGVLTIPEARNLLNLS